MAERRPFANLYASAGLPTTDEGVLERKIEAHLSAEPSAYDSHPSPKDRIAWVRRLATNPLPALEDERDAWSLFEDRERLQLAMTPRCAAASSVTTHSVRKTERQARGMGRARVPGAPRGLFLGL